MITDFYSFIRESATSLIKLLIDTHEAALTKLNISDTNLTGSYAPKLKDYVIYMNSNLDDYDVAIYRAKGDIIKSLEGTHSVLLNYLFLKYFNDDKNLETKFVTDGYYGGDLVGRTFINPMIVQDTQSSKTYEDVLKLLQKIIDSVCKKLKVIPSEVLDKIYDDVFATKFIKVFRETIAKYGLTKSDTITHSVRLTKDLQNYEYFEFGRPFLEFLLYSDYIDNPKLKKIFMQNKFNQNLNYKLISL
jgi:hypothetical protein